MPFRQSAATQYLRDLVEIFERERGHWLFDSFRENNLEGMGSELVTMPPPERYWPLSDKGGLEKRYAGLYASRKANPLWRRL
ncbi:MAG: hypothetical protein NTW74_11645 [Acidobacteria bacterium]|nr:hypothetical protein [Acidobacteriota bacterium]